MSPEWEDELLSTAMEYFPDAMDLAIQTNDEDLFHSTLKAANEILVSKTLSGLIDKGLVEMAGVDDEGEFYFQLTEKGKIVTEGVYNESDQGKSPED